MLEWTEQYLKGFSDGYKAGTTDSLDSMVESGMLQPEVDAERIKALIIPGLDAYTAAKLQEMRKTDA